MGWSTSKILDEFTDLPISRNKKARLRREERERKAKKGITMQILIQETRLKYDSNNVRFMEGKEQIGFGYKGKKEGSIICIIRCPMCRRENYALAVATGYCAFCNYNAN